MRWFKNILKQKDKKEVLFYDSNLMKCYEGETIHYIKSDLKGKYELDFDFAEDINMNKNVWKVLVSIGVIKGFYKDIEKAKEHLRDYNNEK